MAMVATSSTHPLSLFRRSTRSSNKSTTTNRSNQRQRLVVVCNFGDIVRKDIEFMKKGFSWASESLHLPKISRTFDDLLWFRHLENPKAAGLPSPSWPQPYYPADGGEISHPPKISAENLHRVVRGSALIDVGKKVPTKSGPNFVFLLTALTGVDLFMADIKALEAYASYIQHLSRMWSKPLPEIYEPQEIEDYFSCRPHVVTLRFLEVFISFVVATIKLRTSGIFKFYRSPVDKKGHSPEYYFGQMLKETMLNLGPTFIKVGQSLSTRPDIIGTEISKALAELNDRIPPFPRTAAMKIIEEELGSSIETTFSYISEEPVAAASFGQVYRGSTRDGYDVAIKVQRPNLYHVVVRDIYILRLGLGLVQKMARRKNDLRVYADELGKGLIGELDYTLEAANAIEFREAHSSFPFIFVPKVYEDLTRKRVLTMEWVVGENPNDLLLISSKSLIGHGSVYSERQQQDAKKRLLDMVSKGVESILIQLLETGFLHADPHSGNLRYTTTGKIGFLDFGLMCRMEKKHQFAMLSSIVHIVSGDWAGLVHDLTEMDVARTGINLRRVTMDLEDALGEVELVDGIPDIKFSRVLGKVWSVALKYHFRMPPYYTLVLRSLASLEGLAVAADPDFKTFDAAFPYVVQKLLTDNSAASRRILHTVVFNKRKEFQWQKLALFLRVGMKRKSLQCSKASNFEVSLGNAPTGLSDSFGVANMVLKLLSSKDGVVLRRLLMTADGSSLVQAMVSKEAIFFRKQVSMALADLLYVWMSQSLGQSNAISHSESFMKMTSGLHQTDKGLFLKNSASVYDYHSLLKDRRLKVIFYKALESARRQPFLMLRLCWTSLVMFLSAFALACHRVLVASSDKYIASVSFAPRMIAFSS